MSKKLATIITSVPVEFHEENFRLKEWNRDVLNEVFTALEFRTLGKRILGETNSAGGGYTAPEGVQTDLFGNAVKPAGTAKKKSGGPGGNGGAPERSGPPEKLEVLEEASTRLEAAVERGEENQEGGEPGDGAGTAGPAPVPHGGRNIQNTPHSYTAIVGEKAIAELVGLLKQQKEICFDTETTGIDPNDAQLVGSELFLSARGSLVCPLPRRPGGDKKDTGRIPAVVEL